MINSKAFIISGVVIIGLAFTSCSKNVKSIFGNVPSIYENEMRGITKQAEEQATDKAQILSIMMAKSDSAFNAANKKSQEDVKSLIGKNVEYIIDKNVTATIASDITITKVSLPDLHRGSEGMETVTLNFDVKSADSFMYYALESDSCAIEVGTMQIPAPNKEGVSHVEVNVKAPNVPAKYQESCKRIRFITAGQLSDLRSKVDILQKEWREAYKKEMKL